MSEPDWDVDGPRYPIYPRGFPGETVVSLQFWKSTHPILCPVCNADVTQVVKGARRGKPPYRLRCDQPALAQAQFHELVFEPL
jgi:hypothetical protein